MLNRKYFTKENLAKYGLDIDKPYLLTKYVAMIRDCYRDDHLIIGLAKWLRKSELVNCVEFQRM